MWRQDAVASRFASCSGLPTETIAANPSLPETSKAVLSSIEHSDGERLLALRADLLPRKRIGRCCKEKARKTVRFHVLRN